VSLDGLEPAHDSLRGRGSFVRAVAGLEAARDAGLDVSVATMVHAGDIGDFPAMAALVRQLGVRAWHVDVPSECGALTGRADLLLPPADAALFLDYAFGGGTHDAIAGAVCGSHLMAVLPDGTGAKCGFYADRPVGAVELGLAELWRRVPRRRAADLACACDYVDECHGGCRYRASTYNGEESPDPVQCARYGVRPPGSIL
jgi:radical SAM protein with 4Fe4S-binding SPASM domain